MQWEHCKEQLAKQLWLSCRPLNLKKESFLDFTKEPYLIIDLVRLESYSTATTEEGPPAVLLRKNVEKTFISSMTR